MFFAYVTPAVIGGLKTRVIPFFLRLIYSSFVKDCNDNYPMTILFFIKHLELFNALSTDLYKLNLDVVNMLGLLLDILNPFLDMVNTGSPSSFLLNICLFFSLASMVTSKACFVYLASNYTQSESSPSIFFLS